MPSQVWGSSPQEAYENPYEYGIQEQFVREAHALLDRLNNKLQKYSMKFHKDDCSKKKAIWMLQIDALTSLRDSLDALKSKKHRVAAKLFRDVVETLDLAAYFYSSTKDSKKHLKKWYQDIVIPHHVYRDYIRKTKGAKIAEKRKNLYSSLSRFTHRTYRALLDGYGLGKNDMLWHDRYRDTNFLTLPQTIAAYYALLSHLIIEFLEEVVKRKLLNEDEIKNIIRDSLEVKTIPRRFSLKLK